MNLLKNVSNIVNDLGEREYNPLADNILYNSLNALLKEWASQPVDASIKEKQTDALYDKIMTKEPKVVCTNCGQKFVPETNDYYSDTHPAAEWQDIKGTDESTDADAKYNTCSLAVDLNSEFPKQLDYIHSDLGLFQEVYLNNRLNKPVRDLMLQELRLMINTNLRGLTKPTGLE